MSKTVKGMPIVEFNGIKVNTSILSNSSNYYTYSSREVEYIVIHYTGNSKDTAVANAKYFNGGSRGASAHYFVDENSCYQSVELNNAAWAVGGTSNYKHPSCRNKNSISIEMCCSGNYIVSDKTITNAAFLCAELCKLIGVTADMVDTYVLRHYDVWSKSCPAQWAHDNSSGWTDFKAQVKEILRGSEGLTMSQYEELKQTLSTLQSKNAALKAELEEIKNPMIYNYVDGNMPEWAREGVNYCVEHDLIQGTGDGLGLDDKDLKYCTIIMRLYKKLIDKAIK